MFRRKEENSNESGDTEVVTTQSAPSNTNSSENSQTAPTQQTVAPQPHTSHPAPTRAAHETPRAAAPAAGGNYRPAPVAEFNRNLPSRHAPQQHASVSSTERAASTKTAPRILTVGNDILLKGEIATCDRVVIEGRVDAKLHDVHTVEISATGSFKGTAEVEDAEVSGIFEGDLVVKNRLVVYSTGEVRGNITYGEIEIERGGKLTGQIKTVGGISEKPNLLEVLDKKNRKEAAEA